MGWVILRSMEEVAIPTKQQEYKNKRGEGTESSASTTTATTMPTEITSLRPESRLWLLWRPGT
jgi:hypothetical protein